MHQVALINRIRFWVLENTI